METLTIAPKYTQAIAALMSHPTQQAAADSLGISVDTLARWQKEPAFAGALLDARRDVLTRTSQSISTACADAAQELIGIMKDTTASASVRFRAATRIIDYAYKSLPQDEMHARIASLEAQVATLRAALGQPVDDPEPAYNLQFAVQTPEAERLARLEFEAAEQQRLLVERQREEEALKRKREASKARWDKYRQVIAEMPRLLVREIQEAWKTFGDIWFTDSHCEYTRPVSWKQMDRGQRLLAWLLDRYEDYCAGRPVGMSHSMVEGIICNHEDTDGGYRCPKCRLFLPHRVTHCPKCKRDLTVKEVQAAGGKYFTNDF